MTFKFESFLKQVKKSIEKAEIKNRKNAIKHVAQKMRKNISKKGKSKPGDYPGMNTKELKKSIGFKTKTGVKDTSFVGSKSNLAHLLEFGHGDGKILNKRPFVLRTILEEEDNIIKILNEKYW